MYRRSLSCRPARRRVGTCSACSDAPPRGGEWGAPPFGPAAPSDDAGSCPATAGPFRATVGGLIRGWCAARRFDAPFPNAITRHAGRWATPTMAPDRGKAGRGSTPGPAGTSRERRTRCAGAPVMAAAAGILATGGRSGRTARLALLDPLGVARRSDCRPRWPGCGAAGKMPRHASSDDRALRKPRADGRGGPPPRRSDGPVLRFSPPFRWPHLRLQDGFPGLGAAPAVRRDRRP